MRAADRHQEGMLSHSSERGSQSGVSLSGEEEGCEPWYESHLARQRSPSEVFYPVIKMLPAAELFRDVLEDDFEVS